MKRFAAVLKRVGDQLEIAEPYRSRILLEIASDLEDSFEYYLSQGCEEKEAVFRAEEAFAASGEALKHLVQIHQSGLGGIASSVSGQVGRLWEKILLVAILLFELWLVWKALSSDWFLVFVSPFVWPVAALALAAFAFAIWKLYQIFTTSGHAVRRLRSGLGVLLFCAGASLAVTSCGFFFHLQRFFRLNSDLAPESLFMNFAGWMIKISSMMTIGLVAAILTALVWFVLSSLVARAESREIEALLEAEV